jgi:hypothetical protein
MTLALKLVLLATVLLGLAGGLLAASLLRSGIGANTAPWAVTEGRVVDETTGQPIPGAKVVSLSRDMFQLGDARNEARSDAQGAFRLRYRAKGLKAFEVHASGYVPFDMEGFATLEGPVRLARGNVELRNLLTRQVELPAQAHVDSFRVNLESGTVVEGGGDYDVAFRVDPADTGKVLAVAGPGRVVHVEPKTPVVYPGLAIAPDSGYVPVARVPRRPVELICFVRRESGPRYGFTTFYPGWWFPDAGRFRYVSFVTVFNRAGGRGLRGADPPNVR